MSTRAARRRRAQQKVPAPTASAPTSPGTRSSPPPVGTRNAWIRDLSFAGILIALTVLVYSPALSGGFVWDDDEIIVTNEHLFQSLDGLRRIWLEPGATWQYYPMTFTSYWIQYQFWGLDTFAFHLINVLLHALNAILLWRILTRLDVPGAWVAALVVALHPVHVESVAWMSERKNVLSTAFSLSAFLTYTRFAFATGDRRRWRWYGLALGLFVLALFSKTVTSSLPAVILIVLWWKRARVGWNDVLPLVPFFAAGLVMGLTTIRIEARHVGATGPEWDLSLLDRCLIAGRALWFYAGKLVWPERLTFIYPRWQIDAGVWWQYLFPVLAAVTVVGLWAARHRLGRGPVAAVAAFGVMVAPALGFINVYPMRYSFVADHFQYPASLTLITLAVAVAASAIARLGSRAPWLGYAGSAAVCSVLAVLTWQQAHAYTSLEVLWRDTLAKNPSCWMAHNNLGMLLKGRGELDEAASNFRAALRLKPDHSVARYNLGLVLTSQGRRDEAVAAYEEIVRTDPKFPDVHNSLGLIYATEGDLDRAVAYYREALRLSPRFMLAHYNLGLALERRGERSEAEQHFETALRLQPGFKPAQSALQRLRAQAAAATGTVR